MDINSLIQIESVSRILSSRISLVSNLIGGLARICSRNDFMSVLL